MTPRNARRGQLQAQASRAPTFMHVLDDAFL
jgi:hypothetical protein